VITPSPIFPQTWLHPEHKWVYFNDRKILTGKEQEI